MLATETEERTTATRVTFCWGCGATSPGDTCGTCGAAPFPRSVGRAALVGASASIRQRMRSRSGIVVAETPTTAFLAFPDASLYEAPRAKLSDVRAPHDAVRSSAWNLVRASRAVGPKDRRQFDELITSFVIQLVDRSVDEARAFALDALDADCPGWLNKVKLTTSEKDFLFASYHADRGNTAMALQQLLRLPPDRYPTKDLVFLRCLGAIRTDETLHEPVREQLRAFPDRPVGRALVAMVDGGDVAEGTWADAAREVLGAASTDAGVTFPVTLARGFLDALAEGTVLPPDAQELTPETRRLALARAVRGGGEAPSFTLSELEGCPPSLVDDAIELRALSASPEDRKYPLGRYVLARIDPDQLTHDDLVELGYESELARRAFLRGDLDTLRSMPSSSTVAQLTVLHRLKEGEYQRALDALDVFNDRSRDKVESVARCLATATIDGATNEVLTDGTTWPILAPLLPADLATLDALGNERPAFRGIAAWRGLSEAVSKLWVWDWPGAIVDAKHCLVVAHDEQTRDEALNIIAAAHWQLSDDADAVAALAHALEGDYTEGLQVNMGVVAAALEPQLAGEHLGRLAIQAPTLPLRVGAATRALELWYGDPDPWDDQENEHSLPTQLRDALRQLVRADIDEGSFVSFARTLSRWDSDWLGNDGSLTGTFHDGSQAALVYQTKARDFEGFVKALAGVVANDDPPGWATTERDNLVGSAVAALNPTDPNPAAAGFGLVLIDGGLPMDGETYIDLVGFTIVAICAGIDPEEGEPKERFIDLVVGARQRVGEVKDEERERSGNLLDFAAMRVAASIVAARAHEYDQIVEMYNDILFRVRGVPGYQINRSALRSATQPAVDFLTDTKRIVGRLIEIAPEPDFKQSLKEFRDQVHQLQLAFNQLR